MGQGKLLGLVLILAGLVLGLIITAWLGTNLAAGSLQMTGFVLGLGMMAVLVLPFLAVGVVLIVRGRAESRDYARVAKERRLLNLVQARGQVAVAEVAIELDAPLAEIRSYIYDLVGKGLFTGYINWNEGTLYARDAAVMRSTKCPNCGGERELAGKGVVQCRYCGSELFVQ